MMSASVVGLRVLVSMSDPWEFVTENGESRTGTVVGEDTGIAETFLALRIGLDKEIASHGVASDVVFARFRHAESTKQDLLSGRLVPFNFSTKIDGASLSAASGAVAFIGGLRLLS